MTETRGVYVLKLLKGERIVLRQMALIFRYKIWYYRNNKHTHRKDPATMKAYSKFLSVFLVLSLMLSSTFAAQADTAAGEEPSNQEAILPVSSWPCRREPAKHWSFLSPKPRLPRLRRPVRIR